MQEFVQKHWKKLVVGGLASTAAVLLLLLKSHFSNNPLFIFFLVRSLTNLKNKRKTQLKKKKRQLH